MMKRIFWMLMLLSWGCHKVDAYTVSAKNETPYPLKMKIKLAGCPKRSRTIDPYTTGKRGVRGCCVKNVSFNVDTKRMSELGLLHLLRPREELVAKAAKALDNPSDENLFWVVDKNVHPEIIPGG